VRASSPVSGEMGKAADHGTGLFAEVGSAAAKSQRFGLG
jgi:hypothetical protein